MSAADNSVSTDLADLRHRYATDWQRQIINAGVDENIALQAVTLAALNGLFDHLTVAQGQSERSTKILGGQELADWRALLAECGYDSSEAHPECYRNFSFVKLHELTRAAPQPSGIAYASRMTAVAVKLMALNTQWASEGGPFDNEWLLEVLSMLDASSVPSTDRKYECETCRDDPLVCASIPGLRHCASAVTSTNEKSGA